MPFEVAGRANNGYRDRAAKWNSNPVLLNTLPQPNACIKPALDGVTIAKAALAVGHAVAATGHDSAKVTAAIGEHADLLPLKLDTTQPDDAQSAVETAVVRFGRIDVLVNNAGNFYAGFFEELSDEQVRNQMETLLPTAPCQHHWPFPIF